MSKVISCLDNASSANVVGDGSQWAAKRLQKPLLFLHVIERKNIAKADDLSGAIGLGSRSSLLANMANADAVKSKDAMAAGRQLLATACTRAQQAGVDAVEQQQMHGYWLENMSALSSQAYLWVFNVNHANNPLAKAEEGFASVGTYAASVIRQLHEPLLITHNQFCDPQNFMLAYDGHKSTNLALQKMLGSGLLNGLHCHLVTVKNTDNQQHEKFVQVVRLMEQHGISVQSSYLEGAVTDSLMDYKMQHKVDMLVMGAFSHSPLWQMFFGSHTLKVLKNADLPLLVLR